MPKAADLAQATGGTRGGRRFIRMIVSLMLHQWMINDGQKGGQ